MTPNPFSKLTIVNFSIEHPDRIENSPYGTGSTERTELNIYDASGRLVKSFRTTPYALRNTLSWDGRDDQNRMLGSGVYFVKLQIGGDSTTEKLLLVR